MIYFWHYNVKRYTYKGAYRNGGGEGIKKNIDPLTRNCQPPLYILIVKMVLCRLCSLYKSGQSYRNSFSTLLIIFKSLT